ncbi:unnamed protein product [marine sediment metagenome]|uniref:Uncharacterized protein n=1 Tax=marine sediment metagenome TaxID=412755 RepID=X0ULW9_9ZZZZ
MTENYVIFGKGEMKQLAAFVAELQRLKVRFHIENQTYNIYVHIM